MTKSQFLTVKEFCEKNNITWSPTDVIAFISKGTGVKPDAVRDVCNQLHTMGFFRDNNVSYSTTMEVGKHGKK